MIDILLILSIFLYESAEYRDANTWGYHLLNVAAQGFNPDHIIADAGLEQDSEWPNLPCKCYPNIAFLNRAG